MTDNQDSTSQEPGSVFKAVLMGVATDIGGTIIIGTVIGIAYGLVLSMQGLSQEEITQAMKSIGPWSFVGLLANACGFAMSVLGGYVCARVAHNNSYTPIGIMSAISVAYGSMSSGDAEWQTALALNLASLAAIFFGGWWYMRRVVGSK